MRVITEDIVISGGKVSFDKGGSMGANAVGTGSSDGVVLANDTPATVGAQQTSPRLRLQGNGWSTTSGASMPVNFIFEVLPVQGSTAPSGNLLVKVSINGAAYVTLGTLTSAGAFTTLSSLAAGFSVSAAAAARFAFTGRASLSSPAVDLVAIRDTGDTADVHLRALTVRPNAVAFASLPGTPVVGMICGVTDSNTVVWGATVAAGGANFVLAVYNGSVWTVIGK